MMERGLAPFLVSQQWEPYYKTEARGLFASRWPLAQDSVWTIVNRTGYPMQGELLRVRVADPGTTFYDVYHGRKLEPRMDGDDALLSFAVEPKGLSAILAVSHALTPQQAQLLATMQQMSKEPLASFSADWHFAPQTMLAIPQAIAKAESPQGMKLIPGGDFRFVVNGIEIEGRDEEGVDVQYPWEPSPRRYHDHFMTMHPFWIDTHLVTNDQYKKFLDATHYQPSDKLNFLRDWHDGTYPDGWADKPVTWVSLEDARAYATWSGKRLPHEWEWQYAAQGRDGRKYPWGDTWKPEAVPASVTGRVLTPPEAVGAHPLGASPFGIEDMVGYVWQWTDEYQDDHTRAAVLRGGSYYRPSSSIWYFPQAYRNDEHGKFLLMAPSEDRSGGVGFRCVMDAKQQ
jgi:formylglycine-generating enzyme required for sulfatase activity